MRGVERALLAALAAALALTGCAGLPGKSAEAPASSPATAASAAAPSLPVPALPPAPPPPLPPVVVVEVPVLRPDPMEPLLSFADRTRGLQGAELGQEIARQGDAQRPLERVRLALLLSSTGQLYDLVRAQDLLQRVLAATDEESVRLQPFARFMASRLAEQRRREDLLDRQGQQLRELQRRLDQMQSQLEALREIERSLSARPPAAAGSAPNGRPRPPAP